MDLYQSQYEQGLPGLVQEMIPFLYELGVTYITVFSKGQWKKMVKDFLHKKNAKDVTKMSRSCKYKVDHSAFHLNSFRMKKYFTELSTENARIKFKLVSHMLPLAMNHRRQRRFRENGFLCFGCKGLPPPPVSLDENLPLPQLSPQSHPIPGQEPAWETESHLKICWAYSDLRAVKVLSKETDLIQYVKAVLKRREENMD